MGKFWGTGTAGSGPTGVSVDTNGKVWATNYNSWNVVRIDPDAGPLGGGGYRVGAVDLTVGLGSNAYPYNYSDMTGGVLFGAVVGRGTWTVIHDSKAVGTNWGSVSWTSDEPPGTLVQARARSAGTVSGLSGSTYVDAPNGADIAVPDGRSLQVELTLLANAAGERPIVFDVTLRAGCEQDLTASRLAADQGGCPAQVSLSAVVGSGGAVPIPAAAPVAVYDGAPPGAAQDVRRRGRRRHGRAFPRRGVQLREQHRDYGAEHLRPGPSAARRPPRRPRRGPEDRGIDPRHGGRSCRIRRG